MKTSFRGSLAAAVLCATLAACGGDGGGAPAPTALPATVSITGDVRVEAGSAQHFATSLATTVGLTFVWDFGDGTTGAGASTTHTYAKPGTYQVTLAVANTAEDLRTATTTIEVGAYANVTGLNCTQADSAGWCWQHASVTGHQINDVAFVDSTHAWAVGDGLTILKSSDGGTSWTPVALDPLLAPASLRSVRFYDAAHGMALTDRGTALQTADGGATWTLNSLGSQIYTGGAATFVDFSAARIILESSYGNGAMSVDGGATWTAVAMNGQVQATATDCWSVYYSNQLQRAAGCGTTSTPALTTNNDNGYQYITASYFASSTQGLAVGNGFSYLTYTMSALAWETADGGLTWTSFAPSGLPVYNPYNQSLRMLDAQTGVLYVPYDLQAYVTRNGGHDWALATPSTALNQVYASYRASGVVADSVLWQASDNRVAISTDLGQTWKDVTLHAEDPLLPNGVVDAAANVLQYSDANNFVLGINHRFYVTHDGGQSFLRMLGPDNRDAAATAAAGDFSDIRNGRFLTANGALLSTADGGRTWTRQDYPTRSGMPVALHFTSATAGWLLLDGRLGHSTDAGATWSTPLANSAMAGLQGMSWGDATHGWAWKYGALFATSDGGATWTTATLPDNATAITSAVMTGPLTGVVASAYNSLAVTQDGGATWQSVANTYVGGPLVHAFGQTVWTLGTNPQRSKDGGRTWQAAGPVNYSASVIGMAFADALHGWLITNAGTVLRTIDGGDSWSAQPVGTDLALQAVVAVDAMTAWIITRDGQILATASAGN